MMTSFVPVISWTSGVPPEASRCRADRSLLDRRLVRKLHVDQRAASEINAIAGAALDDQAAKPATVSSKRQR